MILRKFLLAGVVSVLSILLTAAFPILAKNAAPVRLLNMFLAPNETAVRRVLPILRAAPPGVIVSVGTERAFMAAANSPSVDSLIIVDRSEAIIIYNRINIHLLKMAKNREHYLQLRLHPEEWAAMGQETGLNADDEGLLSTYAKQWKRYVSEHHLFSAFHRRPEHETSAFAGANYLFDDESFLRIQGLARADRIQVYQFDFGDVEKVKVLVEDLKRSGMPLSLLDISNAYLSKYMSSEALAHLLRSFNEIATNQSVLVTTDLPLIGSFRYSVYYFEHLRKYRSWEDFVRELTRMDLIPRVSATRVNHVGLFEKCSKFLSGDQSLISGAGE